MAATACEDRFNTSSPATFFQLADKDVPAMAQLYHTAHKTLNEELLRRRNLWLNESMQEKKNKNAFFYAALQSPSKNAQRTPRTIDNSQL